MKKLLFITVLLLGFLTVKAEYRGLFIKFTIETKDGKKMVGHNFLLDLDRDSINNTAYIIKRFIGFDNEDTTVIQFFRHRIKYEYVWGGKGKDKDVIYQLLNKTSIKKDRIKKIKINEMIESSYLSDIQNDLTLADTTWMKTTPVRFEAGGGYLCDYQLFFHEYNPELAKLVAEFRKKSKEASANEDDDLLPPLIRKFLKYKVIVIKTCTC